MKVLEQLKDIPVMTELLDKKSSTLNYLLLLIRRLCDNKNKYSIEEINSFLTDSEIKSLNIDNDGSIKIQQLNEYLNKSYHYKELTIKKFQEYITNTLNRENNSDGLKCIITLYSRTIIRYLIPLNEFLALLKGVHVIFDYEFEVDVKIIKEYQMKCLVYFPRFNYIKSVIIIKNEDINLEKDKTYKAFIKSYSIVNDNITIEIK